MIAADEIARLMRRLKRELPPPVPVRYRTTTRDVRDNHGNPCWGVTWAAWDAAGEMRVNILLDRRMPRAALPYVLADEYAHALDNWHDPHSDPHGETWGVWFSRAIRVIHG